ncbi:hypothetical protein ALO95_200423 [Pseudomonas syringae pv. antirrhini]|uniref:Uncharacterized protein n=1 Tax=Pseudomonas syringae pv. antirrhini TaxID=251702 RepID=A0A0P9LC56_9PSED|nr:MULTISPECIES: hypothetical protein [Pseudomonas]KPW51164.1 Uncharacterized protein ALO88_01137 [Pseudomonas syringae pv. antirrhini]RMP28733.1 hypothetical protein ALQ24_03527 [Pseudomonas syringae pv. antirrhini]RMP35540.1 hypothetical protein ALQ23_03148 [Pseudomonas syringae pv. antirrhini]RMW30038.1 hypothetical protein ALO95_200423 [Pseudomonas syringae pv. antirrhini]WIN06280.1 hypothetical protein QQF68_22235 [Pseudomonas syringae pv. antirrhini str. 126]
MRRTGTLNFFEIEKCGLYGFVSDNCYGLEAELALEAIKNWVSGRSFKTTVPWDDSAKSKSVNCYCHDVYKDEATGDFLFVLWKSDPDNDKSMVGVKLDSSGNLSKFLKPETGADQEDVIWGHPSYYWFMPSKKYMVSVKFDNSRCDSDMVHDWLNGCVNFRVKFPGIKKKEEVKASGHEKAFTRVYFDVKREVIEAAESTETKPTQHSSTQAANETVVKADDEFKYKVTFKFKAALKIFSTTDAKINEIAHTTKYVLNRKYVPTYAQGEVLEGWVGGLSRIPVVSKLFSRPSQKNKENLKVELKIETSPSKAEILDIIASSGDMDADGWEKVGFMDQNSRVTWAQEYRLTDSISVEDGGSDVIPAATLFGYLSPKRAEYIASIAKQKELEETAQAALAAEDLASAEAKSAEAV